MKHKSAIGALSRGTLYSILITLVLILALALISRMASLGATTNGIIVQIIKVLSIFYGVGVVMRNITSRAYLWGATLGILYTVLAFLLFSILGSDFDINTGLIVDMLFATAVGIISGLFLKAARGPA